MMLDLVILAITQVSVFSIIPFICWMLTDRKDSFLKWLGFTRPVIDWSFFKLCITTICIGKLYEKAIFFVSKTFMENTETAASQFSGLNIKAIPAILIYAVIQTSLSEEIFFRGFLCKRLVDRFGYVPGNMIQALCFGMAHGVPFYLATRSMKVLLLFTLLSAGIGFYLGYINEKKASGSIILTWILHAFAKVFSGITASF